MLHARKLIMVNFFTAVLLEWKVQGHLLETYLKNSEQTLSSSPFSSISRGNNWRCCCQATVTGCEPLLCQLSAPYLAVSKAQSSHHVKAA